LCDPDAREQQVRCLLESWPEGSDAVLVGGYAVAAYGRARYSVDVDIAALDSTRGAWTRWLREHGLRLDRTHTFSTVRGPPVRVARWHRELVGLDLMTGGIRDRDSRAVVPEEWILRKPARVSIELLSGRIRARLPVVRLEGLWALKLLAGRDTDLTDLFGLSSRPVDLEEVRSLFDSLSTPSLERKLSAVRSRVLEDKLYTDSLSRLRLGSPSQRSNKAAWRHFGDSVDSVVFAKGRPRPSR